MQRRVALLAEGVDRNRRGSCNAGQRGQSPSSRRAWIEIGTCRKYPPRSGSPSSRRAWIEIGNQPGWTWRSWDVALLAEGVDRNKLQIMEVDELDTSPSSRRAWIEIMICSLNGTTPPVALLAEGVDRNFLPPISVFVDLESPSSRRAWIEIHRKPCRPPRRRSPSSRRAWIEIKYTVRMTRSWKVALLAEGVDRNTTVWVRATLEASRPPRGGRG